MQAVIFVAAKRHAAHHTCVLKASFIGCVIAIVFTVSICLCCRTVQATAEREDPPCVSAGTHLDIVMRTFHGDTEDVSVRI